MVNGRPNSRLLPLTGAPATLRCRTGCGTVRLCPTVEDDRCLYAALDQRKLLCTNEIGEARTCTLTRLGERQPARGFGRRV